VGEIDALWQTILARKAGLGMTNADGKSYVRSLLEAGPAKIDAKLREEAAELGEALLRESDERGVSEAADLLFHAQVSGQSAFVFLLFEHQSTVDKLMAFRMLRYVVRILERHVDEVGAERALPLPVVIPVVLHHSATGWTASTRLGELFSPELAGLPELAPHLPQLAFLVDDLSQLTDEELEARNLGDFATLALWSLRDSRSPKRLLRSLSYWASALQRLAVSEAAALEQIFRYLSLVVPDLMPQVIPPCCTKQRPPRSK
jgi:phosphoribosyl-ATP pyrophosphohydrolase